MGWVSERLGRAIARYLQKQAAGYEPFTPSNPDALRASQWAVAGRFDSLLFSHVLEHMRAAQAVVLVRSYLDLLRDAGRVVVETPQEAGFRSDPTHVEYMDFESAESVMREAGLRVERRYSFPFPRPAGRLFKYNQFVTIGRKQ